MYLKLLTRNLLIPPPWLLPTLVKHKKYKNKYVIIIEGLHDLKASLNFCGLNVSCPLKRKCYIYLSSNPYKTTYIYILFMLVFPVQMYCTLIE